MNTISPQQLQQRFERGEPVQLIDVRTAAEFRAVHAPWAENVPLGRLDPATVLQSRNGSSGRPLYIICQSGNRAAKACAAFAAAGFDGAVNVEGGTSAWVDAGLPVERGRGSISLERQVRIVAGLLVLVGSVLGYFVDPYFIALAAFVGAGLAFAGITNSCGMAMLLAKMPWNRASNEDATCCSH